jgi:uncharacterized membrane protein
VKAPFQAELALSATQGGKARVKIYRNKFLVSDEEIELVQGRNLLELPRVALEEGFHEFEAVVEGEHDSVLENNVARAAVRVAGRPKVLLVERREEDARALAEALAGQEIEVEVRPEAGAPESIEDLLNFDVVVLSDVPAEAFSPEGMEAVKTYVREMGADLVMIGGEKSFGLGGYYRTPIEDALPVRMPIKKNVEKPNLALALVIDKSGSMGGEKIEIAKESAIATAEVLQKNDRFGVVAFDSAFEWICPMTDSSEAAAITSFIARLVPGGGTNIYPALYEAWQALLQEDAKLKHIILLSDGQTEGSGYDVLVNHIAADGITLSTVGIGEGAEMQLLGDMAAWAGGESYFTDDFATIPQIFTRETMRASKSMLVEEPFVPRVTGASEALSGIAPEALPFLLGYVATQPKETASVALQSEYGDPVLAGWSFGLGHSAAFTSDAKSRWAAEWIGWEAFGKFWGQLVRSVMSTGAHKELATKARIDLAGGRAKISFDVRDRSGAWRDDVMPRLSLLLEGESSVDVPVRHVAPGLFDAEVEVERYGEFQRLLVVYEQDGEPVDLRALAFVESYSPEFKSVAGDAALLELAARETGGSFDPAAGEAFLFAGEPARTPRDTWWWWLVVAALLLPLDVALRRLSS